MCGHSLCEIEGSEVVMLEDALERWKQFAEMSSSPDESHETSEEIPSDETEKSGEDNEVFVESWQNATLRTLTPEEENDLRAKEQQRLEEAHAAQQKLLAQAQYERELKAWQEQQQKQEEAQRRHEQELRQWQEQQTLLAQQQLEQREREHQHQLELQRWQMEQERLKLSNQVAEQQRIIAAKEAEEEAALGILQEEGIAAIVNPAPPPEKPGFLRRTFGMPCPVCKERGYCKETHWEVLQQWVRSRPVQVYNYLKQGPNKFEQQMKTETVQRVRQFYRCGYCDSIIQKEFEKVLG
jgi:hypothetical protein